MSFLWGQSMANAIQCWHMYLNNIFFIHVGMLPFLHYMMNCGGCFHEISFTHSHSKMKNIFPLSTFSCFAYSFTELLTWIYSERWRKQIYWIISLLGLPFLHIYLLSNSKSVPNSLFYPCMEDSVGCLRFLVCAELHTLLGDVRWGSQS